MSIAPRTVSNGCHFPHSFRSAAETLLVSAVTRPRWADDLENRRRVIVVRDPPSTPLGPSTRGQECGRDAEPTTILQSIHEVLIRDGIPGRDAACSPRTEGIGDAEDPERSRIRGNTECAVPCADQDPRTASGDVEQCVHLMVSIPGNAVREAHRNDLSQHLFEHAPFTRMLPGQFRLDPMDHVPRNV